MDKYYYELNKPARTLTIRQYIYRIGQYRYNWHQVLEILLVMKGRVEMSCGGKTVMMEEDDLILIDSNVGHASLAREEDSAAMVIHLEPEYLEEYYYPLKNWKFSGFTDSLTRNRKEALEIRGTMASMMACGGSDNPGDRLLYEQEVNRLLLLLFRLFPPAHQADMELGRTEKQKDLMERLLDYVEKNYREKISLQDLSRVCRYNPSYLSVYFKNQVGINFYDYLTRIRVREATLELCSTDNTVLDVAHSHGFPDVKAFNTAFRKTFGKSPMEYRRQILAENRGKELLEKREFLPVDDESINRKLAGYERELLETGMGREDLFGSGLLKKELVKSLKKQVDDSSRQLEIFLEKAGQIQKTAEELVDLF